MLNRIKTRFLKQFSLVQDLYRFKENYQRNCSSIPGSFSSPIVSIDELKKTESKIWPKELPVKIEGIALNLEHQLNLLKDFEAYYLSQPFSEKPAEGMRYYFENEYYSYTDALILYSFIRHFNPRKIIEVGSGFSSAVMMDTRDRFNLSGISCTFIDPNPGRLISLMTSEDRKTHKVFEQPVQEVDIRLFQNLQPNDILFIDGSHVCKTASDLNYVLFEILPILGRGVLIHFHDIFYPFEYPKEWVYGGFNWNEVYVLRSFLSYNQDFGIEFFSHYIHSMQPEAFANMPLCYKNSGGNIWLRKVN